MKIPPMPMSQERLGEFMREVFDKRIDKTRMEGQKEYAHDEENAFANFDRLAEELRLDRKKVLWVYAMKHKDGIASYLNGHTSQREDVTGRLLDLIVYLFILWGMIQAEEEAQLEFESMRGLALTDEDLPF